jgi:hypothetical protein
MNSYGSKLQTYVELEPTINVLVYYYYLMVRNVCSS